MSFSFRICNHILLVILVVLAGYIMCIPFVPEVQTWYEQKTDRTKGYRYQGHLATVAARAQGIDVQLLKPIPTQNTLVIPQIGVDSPIIDGLGAESLDLGVWHRPTSSDPVKGGNMVITGHRFIYTTGPKSFYHLDKLNVGDTFFIFWEGTEYTYEVYDTFIVDPSAVEIEADTTQDILTLYTCTPLLTGKDRLVVRAKRLS